jgi:phenylacetate-CoA ligase
MTRRVIPKTSLDSWINHKIGVDSMTRQTLTGYQLRKLQETIDWAHERSPFYHNRFQGLADERLTCLEDLTRLPFTTAQDIQAKALQMLCVSQSEISRVVTLDSSGTTGEPKRLYFTPADQELTIDFYTQVLSAVISPGDRVFILFPGDRPGSIGDMLDIALKRLEAIPIQHGIVKNLAETVQRLADTRANLLIGIPIQALALTRFYEASGRMPPLVLQRMILTTDYVSSAIVKEIRRIWDCEVFDHYGMTEMGLGGGIECYAHQGYHLREADLYFEIIAPQTGRLLPEGQYGEVVFTTLTRRGMPLIRYRTGDLSRFIPGECLCGTILQRLEYIRSRQTGIIMLDDQYCLTMADLDEQLLTLSGVVDFTAVVSRQSAVVLLKIQIMVLAGTVNESDVRKSLGRISSIRLAEESGRLEVLVESLTCNRDFVPRVGKRTISVV